MLSKANNELCLYELCNRDRRKTEMTPVMLIDANIAIISDI